MTGSWTAVFFIVAALDIITALLAITVLRSMRARHIKASWSTRNNVRPAVATRPVLPFCLRGVLWHHGPAERNRTCRADFYSSLYWRLPVLWQPGSQLPVFREYSPTADECGPS